ncbi:uncharacterized protein [Blastocystis hominis]|uniref:Uncharacterized protein n=1 Tax=Blastocystis hominis TaxID=12968 RepID=D8LZ04_BLAHO|nr:uncharacterized protein [Blastocystis hominis]CBK21043.2 unnamed protein product [Blastocystis hominis]|eukprot:XP_012895091.1 uncharacterized protein [Blastocystis hominis]
MNGENPLIDPRDHNGGSSSTINLISGSSSSNMKTSQIHTNSSDVEKENDFSEPEMFFELIFIYIYIYMCVWSCCLFRLMSFFRAMRRPVIGLDLDEVVITTAIAI